MNVVAEPETRSFARVALDVPAAQLGSPLFDYSIDTRLHPGASIGAWVVVPWGRTRRVGLIAEVAAHSDFDPARVKPIEAVIDDAPVLPRSWFESVQFAARYYHRGVGEVALPAIPKSMRTPPTARTTRASAFARARKRFDEIAPARDVRSPDTLGPEAPSRNGMPPVLGDAQRRALDTLRASQGFAVHLLHGVTGSGKTEVYLHWLADVLARDAHAQVLLLVPEIALTPQLAAQVAGRFPAERIAVLHSDLADAERAAHWLAAVEGRARVVIGTRLAVLAPLPALAAIVVDEEHDASYKQQEGVRYSARDLAIAAASQRDAPIVLGSATPSLESWLAARRGRYTLSSLPERISGARLPGLQCVDLRGQKLRHSLTPAAIEAIEGALQRKEQALVFVNRRGYAPVLACAACGWISRCDACSAYRVLHRIGAAGAAHYRLVCHHCTAQQRVPRSCPECGNVDLEALGRGTQRIEEGLAELFPARRIARLDRDVARRRGAAQRVLDAAHAGEVDILVGTQMLAKGHDFRRLTLVVALDSDGGLFSSDFRAPERLFATLMQVAGRAGRGASESRVIVQTRFPDHPLFGYLKRHDYAGFADSQLGERREVGLPPYRYQALLRAEATKLVDAIAFLERAKHAAGERPGPRPASSEGGANANADVAADGDVTLFDPVPMAMSRLAGRERAQLLIEAKRRVALHRFLDGWLPALRALQTNVRWQLDVDPLEI